MAVLLPLMAEAAFAQSGINLAWNDCVSYGGTHDRTVACTNSAFASNDLYQSFVPAADISALGATETTMDVQVAALTLPSWWAQGTDRFAGFAFSSRTSCPAWYDIAPSGPTALAPTITQTAPSRLRIQMGVTVAPGEEQPVSAHSEYLASVIRLKFGPGTFNDPGCLTPACFTLVQLKLTDLSDPGHPVDIVLTSIAMDTYASWRGAGFLGCPAVVPTRKSTWGSIKAVYR